jgi:DNA-binding SARP family transcriptional activator/pimeloyl-ACP methyl ester carboxylesterase
VRFRVLGPVEVTADEVPVAVSAAKERSLLAALLAHANRAVSPDALVDELWGESPPRSANKTLQTYISHLRRLLGDRIRSDPAGYALRVDDGELDSASFERSVREGRLALLRGDAVAAVRALGDALAQWQGEAYAGCVAGPRVAADAVRLEELRLGAVEDSYAARLANGQHRELSAELEAAVAAHPLRELLWGLLIRALKASGRQADALRAFQRARAALAEVGLEPGPELRAVEGAVLDQRLGSNSAAAPPPAASYVTTTDGLRIAYSTVGNGDRDVVYLGDIYLNIELLWEFDDMRAFVETLSQTSRVVVIQRRGTGLSDREPQGRLAPPTACVEDVDAVLDHLGASEVDIVGWGHGGQVALAYSAARPHRVRRVAVLNGYARLSQAPGYEVGFTDEFLETFIQFVEQSWGTTRPLVPIFSEDVAFDPAVIARVSRLERLSATPRQAKELHRALNGFDVRPLLADVRCPVLVAFLTDSLTGEVRARWLADHLPSARFVESPGAFVPTGADAIALAELVEEYLRSARAPAAGRG